MSVRRRIADRGRMASISGPRVVCGLDSSHHAPAVLACASALAQRIELPLDVIHAPEPGDPARVLLDALAEDAVLCVVGARGQGPLRAALLGSVTGELVEEAPCPVVVVPPEAQLPELDERPAIVCRLDGSVDDRPALDAAVWLADRLSGSLAAVNLPGRLAVPTSSTRMLLDDDLEELGVSAVVHVESGAAAEQVAAVAEEHGAALIVAGWDGHVLVPGAVAGRLAARSRVPVMIVPPRVHVRPVTAREAGVA
jgi:nucleotide-binding universal stress UspA family protein